MNPFDFVIIISTKSCSECEIFKLQCKISRNLNWDKTTVIRLSKDTVSLYVKSIVLVNFEFKLKLPTCTNSLFLTDSYCNVTLFIASVFFHLHLSPYFVYRAGIFLLDEAVRCRKGQFFFSFFFFMFDYFNVSVFEYNKKRYTNKINK